MKFLKTNYEKLMLLLVMVGFVTVIAVAWIGANKDKIDRQNRKTESLKGKTVDVVKVDITKILAALESPNRWTFPRVAEGPRALINSAHKLFTPIYRANEVKIPRGVELRFAPIVPPPPPTPPQIFRVEEAVKANAIKMEKFHLIFKGTIEFGGKVRFQINFVATGETKVAEMNETVGGFTVLKYEEKIENNIDVSELYVQRGDKTPVKLIYNKIVSADEEQVAVLNVWSFKELKEVKVKLDEFVTVELNVKGQSRQKHQIKLKVVDIGPNEVVLEQTDAPNQKYRFAKGAKEGVPIK